MPWEPVPYLIGNNAVHSESVMRLLAYVAFNGGEGVVGGTDCKVAALGTPGASVTVSPGAAAILGRGSSQKYEGYAARMNTQDTVSVAPTGAGSGRSDLIVARVEDPNVPGSSWQAPANLATGPYMFTRVISGVPASTTKFSDLNRGESAIALARIDLPANTAAVTSAMIKDLRQLAVPHSERLLLPENPTTLTMLPAGGYQSILNGWSVVVPPWCTRMVLSATLHGVRLNRLNTTTAGTAAGAVRVATGWTAIQGAAYDFETTATNNYARFTIGAGDTVTVPSNVRGLATPVRIELSRTSGNTGIVIDTATYAQVDIEFQETPA